MLVPCKGDFFFFSTHDKITALQELALYERRLSELGLIDIHRAARILREELSQGNFKNFEAFCGHLKKEKKDFVKLLKATEKFAAAVKAKGNAPSNFRLMFEVVMAGYETIKAAYNQAENQIKPMLAVKKYADAKTILADIAAKLDFLEKNLIELIQLEAAYKIL